MKTKTRFQAQNEYRKYIGRIRARYGSSVDACFDGSGWEVYREVREQPGIYGVRMKILWHGTNLWDAVP